MIRPFAQRIRHRRVAAAVLGGLVACTMTVAPSFGVSGPYQERQLINCVDSPCVATFKKVPAATRLNIQFASCYITSSSQMFTGISMIGVSPAFGVTNKFRHHLIWRDVNGDGAYWAVSQPVLLDIGAGKLPEIQVVRIFGAGHSGECSISGQYFDDP